MRPRGALRARLLLLTGALLAGLPSQAWAQTATPSAPQGPRVEGSVTGDLEAGSTLTITVDATMPGGWEGLHLIDASIHSGSEVLDTIRFEVESYQLSIDDGQEILVGTGAVATGEYIRVSGADVIVTTGGGNLSFEVGAEVLKTIPDDAAFELSVTDDAGTTTSVTEELSAPQIGFTWETVITAVLIALLAGGFVGNLFASKRRPAPRVSVYGSIQRRIDEERAPKGERSA
jgi:hypothetical protein